MVRLTTYERSIKLLDRPLIPRDIIESDLSLQSYLEENVKEKRNHEKYRLRSAKAVRTRKKNLEAAARKITVTPSTDSESTQQQTNKWKAKSESVSEADPTREEIRRVDICKQEPREGSLVTE